MAYASWSLREMADPNAWWQGRLQSIAVFQILMCVSSIGLPFMAIGGSEANPRFFWCACIIVGSIYLILIGIFALVIMLWGQKYSYPTLILVGIPAYLSIGLGIFLRKF